MSSQYARRKDDFGIPINYICMYVKVLIIILINRARELIEEITFYFIVFFLEPLFPPLRKKRCKVITIYEWG